MLGKTEYSSIPLIIGQMGSVAYGTNTEDSDVDFMSVVLPSLSCYTGLSQWANDGTMVLQSKEKDHTSYELHKFAKLMLAFNPNVVPLLYLPERCYEELHPLGEMLIENRKLFGSKRVFDTFNGFAKSQMHKVRDKITGKLGQKRKDLIAKYGYDVKFAMHTIRILRMAKEFVTTGEMNVDRRGIDASELLQIKTGALTEEEFFEKAEQLLAEVENLKENSTLPDEPYFCSVNSLVMEIIEKGLIR